MSKVTFSIADRSYTVACGEGEEAHVSALGEVLDAKLAQLGITSGQDAQKLLFAGLAVADELHDSKAKLASAHSDAAAARESLSELEDSVSQAERDVTELGRQLEASRSRLQEASAQTATDLSSAREEAAQANLALSARDDTIRQLRRELAEADERAQAAMDAPVPDDLAPALEQFADLLEAVAVKLEKTAPSA
ncbi:MAG: cell division protein ZapA [Parerythrobacter sp.]